RVVPVMRPPTNCSSNAPSPGSTTPLLLASPQAAACARGTLPATRHTAAAPISNRFHIPLCIMRLLSRWFRSFVAFGTLAQRIVTVQVTPSTGRAWPPSNFVGELTAQPVTDVWVMHAFSPGQPPATVVQGPSGGRVGKVPTGHEGGFAGHLRTQPPNGP